MADREGDGSMQEIQLAIEGAGHCGSALLRGLESYRARDANESECAQRAVFGDDRLDDIQPRDGDARVALEALSRGDR